jgi:hypothetical protein
MRPKRWAWPFLGWDGILQKSLWISDKIGTYVSKNDFWKKNMSKLWSTCCSNLDRFQLNWHIFVNFLRGGYKTFSKQTTCELCIKYDIIFYKNVLVHFWNICLVGASQKKPFLALRKWKMNFLCQEKENTQNEHCFTYQEAHICTIWGNLNKLYHGYVHN